MAYRKPIDLDGFIQQMPKADMRVKTQLAEDLVTFLSDDTNSIVCTDMGLLVDNLMPWLTGSHFKIAQKALEAFSELIKRLGPDFNAYTANVLTHVIDRLGDSKDTVREKAQLLLLNLMEHRVLTPQALLDKLANTCLKHKNAKVREEFLQTIVNTLNEYGTTQLSVRPYIQLIATHLLGDPNAVVRDSAIQTLVEIYKHVGERMRSDLRRMEDIPPAKLSILEQKFAQVKDEGLLLKSAATAVSASISSINSGNGNGLHSTNGSGGGGGVGVGGGIDESDFTSIQTRTNRLVKRIASATTTTRAVNLKGGDPVDAGALTMEIFEACFENVPQLNVFSGKDLDDVYKQIFSIIGDKNSDWEKRVETLKKVRALLMAQAHNQTQFVSQLKDLAICFLDILKEELRSQVIREACITIAYMSKTLRQKFDQFCISILDQLIMLIQNSAKVIASSSFIALKYIVKYTHAPKIIKLITENYQQSKSKDIRASLCEILCLLLEEWPTKYLERHANLLRDTLKKSISDADNEARRHSRRAYWLYRQHFPELADIIYGTLDIATQRALERERDGGSQPTPGISSARCIRVPGSSCLQKPTVAARSVSAVDSAAAQRAKARHQYALSARKKVQSTNNAAPGVYSQNNNNTGSLPRPRYGMGTVTANASIAESTGGRTRSRSGVSQSQPGSRSTSPSSKLRDQYVGYYKPITGTISKKSIGSTNSGIPRSLANSRETSPTRGPMKRSLYSFGNLGSGRRSQERTTSRPLAAMRMLQQSREAEGLSGVDLLSQEDSMQVDHGRTPRYGRKLLSREESDDSEASSVCSERSFESSYTRAHNSSSYSLSGSRHRLDWSGSRAICEDMDTIIQYCASTHWAERKDGLNSLTHYLSAGKELTPSQLQSVLDMFRKMFMDTHTKVYSLFLDAVIELILVHANDLHDWLFILLTRLFNKLGTELLNSMTGKILKTLQVVHEYFPTDLQMRDILRILSDNAQTPCIKSKIAMLKFLTELVTTYCQPSDLPAIDNVGGGTGSNSLSVDRALLKIIQLCFNQKSLELNGQARVCLVSLYNCNTPQMTKWLAVLPKAAQDDAKTIIQTFLEFQSDTSNANASLLSTSSSPKPLQSPSMASFTSLQSTPSHNASSQSSQAFVNQELYSQLDVQHNIHKTSEEIRHYTSSVVSHDTASQMSLLSNKANANGLNGYTNAADQLDSNTNSYCCDSKTQSAATTETNTPESGSNKTIEAKETPSKTIIRGEEFAKTDESMSKRNENNQPVIISYKITDTGELFVKDKYLEREIIKMACSLNADVPLKEMQDTLNNLSVCIKAGNGELPNKHFRAIMKMLVELIDTQQPEIVKEALLVLSKIIRNENMRSKWMEFLELILLRIIGCYHLSKETAREIDAIMPRIAPALPLHAVIDIVNPVIATSPYPLNLCAVKILSELAERHGSELTESHLESVFPNLARLADVQQSSVRKAAVFCIVKLYFVMGEDKVTPKFSMLTPSKVRLLNLYIEKQRTSPSSTSTKTSSAASSS